MKKLTLVILVLFITLPTFGVSYDLTLQWDENTEPDLATGTNARYKIYIQEGTSLNGLKVGTPIPVLVADDENTDPALVQYTIPNLDDQITYYVALTALDNDGNESDLSNEVNTLLIDATPPAAPKGFNILRWMKQMISKYFGGGLKIVS